MAPQTGAETQSAQKETNDAAVKGARAAHLWRRDKFAMAFGAAILQRGQGRTPLALAREVIPMVDAFMLVLDGETK